MFNTVHAMAICAMAFASLSATSALADEPILIKFSHVVADATPKGQAHCCSSSWSRSAWPAR